MLTRDGRVGNLVATTRLARGRALRIARSLICVARNDALRDRRRSALRFTRNRALLEGNLSLDLRSSRTHGDEVERPRDLLMAADHSLVLQQPRIVVLLHLRVALFLVAAGELRSTVPR